METPVFNRHRPDEHAAGAVCQEPRQGRLERPPTESLGKKHGRSRLATSYDAGMQVDGGPFDD